MKTLVQEAVLELRLLILKMFLDAARYLAGWEKRFHSRR